MAPSSTQTLVSQAEKAYQKENYAEAASLFQQASGQFAAEGHALKAAEQANNQSVALLRAGDAQSALQAAQGTETIFAQAGDRRRQALAYGNQAAALEALGRFAEAMERYRQSAELLKETGDVENRAMVLKSISALQIRTGHQLEALASMESALNQKPRLSLQERFLKKLLAVPFRMLRRE